ncbi:MAG: hypothetical protein KJ697_02380 [Nanoarchaeota archaeon]|nr:hypothetical protein [Nanoarchaeota archaeon]MBU4123915.1 hypothetical protein [Nanoarchaeota archaeon]
MGEDRKYGIFAVKEWKEENRTKRQVINSGEINREEYENLKLSGDQPNNSLISKDFEIKYRAFEFEGTIERPKVSIESMIKISLEYFISSKSILAG